MNSLQQKKNERPIINSYYLPNIWQDEDSILYILQSFSLDFPTIYKEKNDFPMNFIEKLLLLTIKWSENISEILDLLSNLDLLSDFLIENPDFNQKKQIKNNLLSIFNENSPSKKIFPS